MRVVHTVPALFSSNGGVVGGAERYAFELARYMSSQMPTTLVTFGDRERHEKLDDLQIRVIGQPWHVRGQRSNPLAVRPLLSQLRTADIVHCHQQHVVASSLAAAFCKITRKRVFVSDLGGGGWDVSAYISTDNWYDGHLHISEFSRKVFKHAAWPKAHVILGGVDTQKFSPDESVPKAGTILYVGRLLPHKGINYLVEALPEGMTLEIIGQPYDEKFVGHLKQLSQGRNVLFRHDFDDQDLVEAYRRASCVVLPSVYKTIYGDNTEVPELLGQTLLEGMACGLPAICSDVASMPEVVEHNRSGFVVPPNNPAALREKLEWIRDHPNEAKRMGANGRSRVLDLFTWPRVVQRCLEIYKS